MKASIYINLTYILLMIFIPGKVLGQKGYLTPKEEFMYLRTEAVMALTDYETRSEGTIEEVIKKYEAVIKHDPINDQSWKEIIKVYSYTEDSPTKKKRLKAVTLALRTIKGDSTSKEVELRKILKGLQELSNENLASTIETSEPISGECELSMVGRLTNTIKPNKFPKKFTYDSDIEKSTLTQSENTSINNTFYVRKIEKKDITEEFEVKVYPNSLGKSYFCDIAQPSLSSCFKNLNENIEKTINLSPESINLSSEGLVLIPESYQLEKKIHMHNGKSYLEVKINNSESPIAYKCRKINIDHANQSELIKNVPLNSPSTFQMNPASVQ